MKIDRFDHIAIYVKDVEATIHFYVDILGMALDRSGGHVALKFGQQKINIHQGRDETFLVAGKPDFGTADFCLVAAGDIKTIYAELKAKGAVFEPMPDGIKKKGFESNSGIVHLNGALGPMDSIYLRDPDGNLVEISSYGQPGQD
jgi:catechol 2,3-dioxygenase-like lactoylglutathione lyase family enzyme